MKTQYKYIHFCELSGTGSVLRYLCINNRSHDRIGVVGWYSAWRRNCFYPDPETIFDCSCLDDISHFMKQLGKPEVNDVV